MTHSGVSRPLGARRTRQGSAGRQQRRATRPDGQPTGAQPHTAGMRNVTAPAERQRGGTASETVTAQAAVAVGYFVILINKNRSKNEMNGAADGI